MVTFPFGKLLNVPVLVDVKPLDEFTLTEGPMLGLGAGLGKFVSTDTVCELVFDTMNNNNTVRLRVQIRFIS